MTIDSDDFLEYILSHAITDEQREFVNRVEFAIEQYKKYKEVELWIQVIWQKE